MIIEEMLRDGVNINNYQEVYNYFHGMHDTDIDKILTVLDPQLRSIVTQLLIDYLQGFVTNTQLNQAIQDKVNKSDLTQSLNLKIGHDELNQGLSNKLDKADYQQHFRGVFISIEELSAIIDPMQGDYAHVDAGVGSATVMHSYDADDGVWREQKSTGVAISNTDELVEGNRNLYFTEQRVLNIINPMMNDIENVLNQILGA